MHTNINTDKCTAECHGNVLVQEFAMTRAYVETSNVFHILIRTTLSGCVYKPRFSNLWTTYVIRNYLPSLHAHHMVGSIAYQFLFTYLTRHICECDTRT
jgi:hypothetical protein